MLNGYFQNPPSCSGSILHDLVSSSLVYTIFVIKAPICAHAYMCAMNSLCSTCVHVCYE